MNKKSIVLTLLALVLSLTCLTGCRQHPPSDNGTELAAGGILVLRVNPEIAIEYDENGLVTAVSARNEDALNIISGCSGLIGQETRLTITALVSAIGEAGYFVEEIEGERRQITLEIESGSQLPHDLFLDEIVADVHDCVNKNNWNVPMDIENESDYGLTEYDPDNTDATDYLTTDDADDNDMTDYGPGNSPYAVSKPVTSSASSNSTDYGQSDYDDGSSPYTAPVVITPPAASGTTDYGQSDYDDGSSPYTAPVVTAPPTSSGTTDYGQSDYDDGSSPYTAPVVTAPPTSSGTTDYGQSDYDDGDSPYTAPVVTTPPTSSGTSDYGQSDYDDGASQYDSSSDYDNSDYGSSDYDD